MSTSDESARPPNHRAGDANPETARFSTSDTTVGGDATAVHDTTAGRDTTARDTDNDTFSRSREYVPEDDYADTAAPVGAPVVDSRELLRREKEEFGGVKIGSAFFGWLTATGTAVILSALAAAFGFATGSVNISDVAGQATRDPQGTALVGAIVFGVILLVAYYCGGYVAGRMARFNGVAQGVAVWGWAVVISVVAAGLATLAGSRFNILEQVSGFGRMAEGADLLPALLGLLVAAVVALIGAILGGLAGMRFHRRVDRAGLGR
ncbi:hypothetical protein [Arthrobacter sp. KK5.5]|uniref:hypothetical protein n=1 Tax=Arthrobacter sp. KK5.5 TaxID=3373084 RepID=UPI003EE61B6C